MIRTVRHLKDVFQTGREMARLVCNYWTDLGPWLGVSFREYYIHICQLPYIADPEDVETVSRPAFTLRRDYAPRDCDDKAVLMACWCHGHGLKCRFVASSTRPDKVCTMFSWRPRSSALWMQPSINTPIRSEIMTIFRQLPIWRP